MSDLGSRNGTGLNGRLVGRGETLVVDGDLLRFGEVEFCYLESASLYTKLRPAPR